uniref:Replication initiation and membrane attachment n=1 Tax=Siphoviridae sp. ct2hZ16 TaxID=2826276 RepID=A0A8S5QVU5_9CAUD|nr:MAG TPA: Replication initiation and membrane attachment [Siphoviridae sp. ct2hZ16]
MAELAYIKLWAEFEKYFGVLGAVEVGRLILGAQEYAFHGTEPQFTGNERILWPVLKESIDKDKAYNEKQQSNGSKGGRPTKPNETQQNPEKPNETQNNPTKPHIVNRKQKTEDNMKMMMDTREDETPEPGSDAQACFECYEQNIGTMSRAVYEEINAYLQQLPADLVCEAIQEAARNNARSWKYAATILRGCLQKNILTKAAYLSDQEARKQKTSSRQSAGQRRSTQETLRRIAMGGSDDISGDSSAFVVGEEKLEEHL